MKTSLVSIMPKVTFNRLDKMVTQVKKPDNSNYDSCYNYNIYKNNFEGNNIAFGTLRRNNYLGLAEDTAFFRDLNTLNAAVDILKSNFPDGAEILDYACSDGQEALSLLALLGKDYKKFDIKGFDKSYKLISNAKFGHYLIINGYWDDFLVKFSKNRPERKAASAFRRIMKREPYDYIDGETYNNAIRRRDYMCNNFYSVRSKYNDVIKYNDGDIEDIDKIKPEKQVGAVFFRNAFYHVFRPLNTDNKNTYREMTFDEITEKSDEIIGKIDEVLAPGGIFVMGDIIHEHLIKVNKDDNCDKIKILDAYGNIDSSGTINTESFIAKESPIVKALQDRGFRPVHMSKCLLEDASDKKNPKYIDVPTIWQKPKN